MILIINILVAVYGQLFNMDAVRSCKIEKMPDPVYANIDLRSCDKPDRA
jgi:hypothetical protein